MRYRRQAGWALIGAVVMALILLAAVTMVRTTTVVDLIRETQQENTTRAQETQDNTETIRRVADRIDSCTNPDGECFKEGQARTGKAVASINDVIIAAAACAKVYTAEADIRACVVRSINGPKGRR